MEGGAAISVLKVDISQEGPLSGTPALFSAGGINRKNSMGLSLKTGGDLDLAEDQPTARPVDMPPSPSSIGSPRSSPPRTYSPPRISQSMSTKRNPKRLSLSIPITEAGPSTSVAVGRSLTPPSDNDNTPYTPGPPQTPAMAMTLPRVRSRRPNLLSLITQPPTAYDVSLTPGGKPYPYATVGHPRRRSNTTDDPPAIGVDPRSSRSANPRLNTLFPPIQETGPRVASPSSSSSRTASLSSTPSSSPPLPHLETPYSTYSSDPYANGPIEIIPGVYLGAEESMYAWSTWARSKRVRILNVAQEIEDPFSASGITPLSRKCKGKISRAVYPEDMQEGRPEVDYVHLAWSHGESGLAEMVEGMQLDDVIKGRFDGDEVEGKDQWKFWEAIRFMEYGRQRGEAVLIHCQCGVSRSATLVIAYTMALAAAGIVPEHLGHLKGMQNAYDFVKGKSNWIGPNVSLVFQLLEFSRNITTLLSSHLASHPGDKILTSWPSAEQAAQTEADWARQRAQFDQEPGTAADGPPEKDIGGLGGKLGEGIEEMTIDEEAIREAEVLDEAMRVRRLGREADK